MSRFSFGSPRRMRFSAARVRVGAIAIGALFLALASGCASTLLFLEGGPREVLTAQAVGERPTFITTWGYRKLPDGEWEWRAINTVTHHEYFCTFMPHTGEGANCAVAGSAEFPDP